MLTPNLSFELVQGLFIFEIYLSLSPEKGERKLNEILSYLFCFLLYRSYERRYYLLGNLAMSIINTNIMFIINSRIVKTTLYKH